MGENTPLKASSKKLCYTNSQCSAVNSDLSLSFCVLGQLATCYFIGIFQCAYLFALYTGKESAMQIIIGPAIISKYQKSLLKCLYLYRAEFYMEINFWLTALMMN